jgi:hypothetical protein
LRGRQRTDSPSEFQESEFMKANRMLVVVMCCSFLAVAARASHASDKSDVVDAVHHYLDNLEPGKLPAALAMCDSEVSILDEFPPHVWHGPKACADWFSAERAYNEKSGITDDEATLGAPLIVDAQGEYAYFVAPMVYTYKQRGKSVKETATFTVTLKRTAAGWRIIGWAYSKQKVE